MIPVVSDPDVKAIMKVSVFVGISVEGFIARQNGEIDSTIRSWWGLFRLVRLYDQDYLWRPR